jgi:leucyl-tRNA synthetase
MAPWPSYREDALSTEELVIVVQVNGKLRSKFSVDVNADESTIKEMALSDERVLKFIQNKPIKRVVAVRNKLVNIVV